MGASDKQPAVGRLLGRLSTLEVYVLSEHWNRSIPFPLTFQSEEPLERQEHDMNIASAMFDSDPPMELDGWAGAMLEPDLRVECWLCDPTISRGDTMTVRICAVRAYDKGYVAIQRPGIPDGQFYQMVDIFQTHAIDLARAVVDAVPSATAGSYGDIDERDFQLAHARIADGEHPYPLLQSARATTVGTLQVSEGASTEWRMAEAGPDLIWSDRENLGRYVITQDALLACDDERLISEINRRIKVVVARVREKRERAALIF